MKQIIDMIGIGTYILITSCVAFFLTVYETVDATLEHSVWKRLPITVILMRTFFLLWKYEIFFTKYKMVKFLLVWFLSLFLIQKSMF